ncbi:NnrS family protein [Rhodobacteraceae bacterium B1Z28]|uniref:NnrS family protein n=1 Tax=Ruegeria haliotis TaxID=2747601 RepID=A0ABX2PVK8_9RHOB|nr:NnrS family protein [Ruegeria haliotis]NVO58053.1 NnrS family protein [Ruegeria haliotis]
MGRVRGFRNFWQAPYRPLFLAAFLCPLLTVAWWPLGVWFGLPGPLFEPVILWHVHELFFGFAAAAIGGYLLTALPGWTGQSPVRGGPLKALLGFWISARFATALASALPPVVPIVLNAGYFLLLAGIIGQQLLSAKAYRKLGFLFIIAALGSGEVLFLGTALAGRSWIGLAIIPVVLIGMVMLMVSIGTRAIPAFTDNWLARISRENRIKQSSGALTQVLLATVIIARVMGWHDIASVAVICAALTLLWTMRGWQSLSALGNPLLAALHLAFLWLPIGLLAMGFAALAPAIYPMGDALHAITIGGMSGLIMAIAGRAAAHTKTGDMQANLGFMAGVLLVWIATVVRLIAPILPHHPVEIVAAALWCTGWVAFTIGFLPAVTGPLRRPVLSGQRYGAPENNANMERAD